MKLKLDLIILAAVPFMIFQMTPLPALRSMASKVVSDEQYGKTLTSYMINKN